MCVTDRHDMTLAVKVALNLITTNQPIDIPVEAIFLYGDVLPVTSDGCETGSQWRWKDRCVSTGLTRPEKNIGASLTAI